MLKITPGYLLEFAIIQGGACILVVFGIPNTKKPQKDGSLAETHLSFHCWEASKKSISSRLTCDIQDVLPQKQQLESLKKKSSGFFK